MKSICLIIIVICSIISINCIGINPSQMMTDLTNIGNHLGKYFIDNLIAGNETNLALFGFKPTDFNVSNEPIY